MLHTSDGNAIPLTGTFLVKTDFAETWAVSFYSTWLDDGKFLVVDGANVAKPPRSPSDGHNIPNFRKLGNNHLSCAISDFTFYGQALVLTKASGSTITYSVPSTPNPDQRNCTRPPAASMIVPINEDLGSVATINSGTYAGASGGLLPNGQFVSDATSTGMMAPPLRASPGAMSRPPCPGRHARLPPVAPSSRLQHQLRQRGPPLNSPGTNISLPANSPTPVVQAAWLP